ncbi:uncharacterized protein METZ01_LOCUS170061 [marine metagenome]|uniref:Uncharacterized protein n=1 Tax=marine metagenome TaxID=408172 RepID=A0A382BVG7_9ZZZZ
MAYKVTREKRIFNRTMMDTGSWVFDGVVIEIVADTYSELITGIDEIPDTDLTWFSEGRLGIEGMPNKVKGKWVARLKTPLENKRREQFVLED